MVSGLSSIDCPAVVWLYNVESPPLFSLDSAGAVSTEHPTNPRLQRDMRGQRKPKKITIESYRNRLDSDESRGVLPKSSREQTPMDEMPPPPPLSAQEFPGEIAFFSGNPFVEVTKGILHLYKRK